MDTARLELVERVRAHKGQDEYSDYIRNVLAGDMAGVLVDMLDRAAGVLTVPYNVHQAKAWIEVVRVLNHVWPTWHAGSDSPHIKAARCIGLLAHRAKKAEAYDAREIAGWQFRYLDDETGHWSEWMRCPASLARTWVESPQGFEVRALYAGAALVSPVSIPEGTKLADMVVAQ